MKLLQGLKDSLGLGKQPLQTKEDASVLASARKNSTILTPRVEEVVPEVVQAPKPESFSIMRNSLTAGVFSDILNAHAGLTSSDITDNARLMSIAESHDVISANLQELIYLIKRNLAEMEADIESDIEEFSSNWQKRVADREARLVERGNLQIVNPFRFIPGAPDFITMPASIPTLITKGAIESVEYTVNTVRDFVKSLTGKEVQLAPTPEEVSGEKPYVGSIYSDTATFYDLSRDVGYSNGQAMVIAGLFALGATATEVAGAGSIFDDLSRSVLLRAAANKDKYAAWYKLGMPKTLEEAADIRLNILHNVHPDKFGGSEEVARSINAAYSTLKEQGIPDAGEVIGTLEEVSAALQTPVSKIIKEGKLNTVRDIEEAYIGTSGLLPGFVEEDAPPFSVGARVQKVKHVGGADDVEVKVGGLEPLKSTDVQISTKVVNQLMGKTFVSKQEIIQLSKQQGVKDAEKEALLSSLEDFKTEKIPAKDYAEAVQSRLLPLKVNDDKFARGGIREPLYEEVVLPDELRGPVADYHENVYESPIKTSAGDVHGFNTPNYFAHTRIEDLPIDEGSNIYTKNGVKTFTNSRLPKEPTRRVIELQSDLFQKGRLEGEVSQVWADSNFVSGGDKKAMTKNRNMLAERKAEVAKLEPYRNTWHERIIREEIKQAAKDGKTKLQFPTGETAMKIEGLGDNARWEFADQTPVKVEDLKVGLEIADDADYWIITDVLGDGKFKAVQKSQLEDVYPDQAIPAAVKSLRLDEDTYASVAETFDISGKVDTSNPIYKFYEKDVQKFLQKFGGKKIVDAQGVSWIEIQVNKDAAAQPMQAFGAVAGYEIEEDEDGNLRLVYNPVKGIIGAAMIGASRRVKMKGLGLDDASKLVTRTEKQLLRERFVNQVRGARAGFKAGYLSAKENAIAKLKSKEFKVKEAKEAIVKYADMTLAKGDRGTMLVAVRDAKTRKDVAKAWARIDNIAENAMKKAAIVELKDRVGKILQSNVVDVGYKERIERMVQGIDFTVHKKSTLDSLKETNLYIMKKEALGEDVTMPERILEKISILGKTSVGELTSSQIEGLIEDIELLEQLGKTKFKARSEIYQFEKEVKTKSALETAIPLNNKEMLVPAIGDNITRGQEFVNRYRKLVNSLKRINTVLMPIDGLAKVTGMSTMKNEIDLAYGKYLTRNDDILTQRLDMLNRLGLTDANMERIGIYAASRQEGGVEKLANSGITQDDISKINLTPAEIEYYNFVRRIFDEQYPVVRKYMLEIYNRDVGQVDNYVSFMTDFDEMSDLEVYQRFGSLSDEPMRRTKTVEQGFTKSRRGAGRQKILLNIDKIFLRHIDDVAYMAEMGKPVKMWSEIVAMPEFTEALGDMGKLMWLEYLDLLARKGGADQAKRIPFLDVLRRNVGAATLSFKVSSAMVQLTSFADGASAIGGKFMLSGAADIASSRRWREFVRDNFPEIRATIGDDPAFIELKDSFFGKVSEAGMTLLKKMDGMVRMSVAAGAYRKYLADNGMDVNLLAPNAEAVAYAQKIVRKTQASSFFKDTPLAISKGLLTGNRSVDKFILQLQTFTLSRWDNIKDSVWREGFGKGNIKQGVASTVWLLVVAAALEEGIRNGVEKLLDAVTGADKRDDDDGFVKTLVTEAFHNVPLFGSLMYSLAYDSNPVPVIKVMEDSIKGFGQMLEGQSARTQASGANKALFGMLSLLGVPGSQQANQLISGTLREPVDEATKILNDAGIKDINKLVEDSLRAAGVGEQRIQDYLANISDSIIKKIPSDGNSDIIRQGRVFPLAEYLTDNPLPVTDGDTLDDISVDTLPFKNNNPGNLKYAHQTDAIGKDKDGFAIFPDAITGMEALARDLKSKVKRKPDMTVDELVHIYTQEPHKVDVYVEALQKYAGVFDKAQDLVQTDLLNALIAFSSAEGFFGNGDERVKNIEALKRTLANEYQ